MVLKATGFCLCLTIFVALLSQSMNAGIYELHVAVMLGKPQRLRELLNSPRIGEKINVQDTATGWTPLHLAVLQGSVVSLKLLLKAKANPFVRDFRGKTPMAYALAIPNSQLKGHIVYRLLEAQWNR